VSRTGQRCEVNKKTLFFKALWPGCAMRETTHPGPRTARPPPKRLWKTHADLPQGDPRHLA
jgi:hypothetical protein